MKLYSLIICSFIIFTYPLVCTAMGDWSGGGGKFFEDESNPWFLEHTKIIRYCVRYQEDKMSISLEKSKELIVMAFNYWKKEFKNLQPTHNLPPTVDLPPLFSIEFKIATQKIQITTCDKDHDVTFQLGFLSVEQKKKFSNYKKYVAITSRTAYDKVNLKGKGFVYISNDLENSRFDSPKYQEKPWSHGEGGLFLRSLIHELGHIFGLQHIGDTIMNLNYLDYILQIKNSAYYSSLGDLPFFFHYLEYGDGSFFSLDDHYELMKYFKIPRKYRYARVHITPIYEDSPIGEITSNPFQYKFNLYVSKSASSRPPAIIWSSGLLKERNMSATYQTAISVYLPKEQRKIYIEGTLAVGRYHSSNIILQKEFFGFVKNKNGLKRNLLATLKSNQFFVEGITSKGIFSLFQFYNYYRSPFQVPLNRRK